MLKHDVLPVRRAHQRAAWNRDAGPLSLRANHHAHKLPRTEPRKIAPLDREMHRYGLAAVGKAGAAIAHVESFAAGRFRESALHVRYDFEAQRFDPEFLGIDDVKDD